MELMQHRIPLHLRTSRSPRRAPLDLTCPLPQLSRSSNITKDKGTTCLARRKSSIFDSGIVEPSAYPFTASSYRPSLFQESSDTTSIGSTESPSPTILKKEESELRFSFQWPHPPVSISRKETRKEARKEPRRGSLKRKLEDDKDSDNEGVKLPSFQTLFADTRHEWPKWSRDLHHAGRLPTPSTSPAPSDGQAYSRRPSLFTAEDPITEELNCLRVKEHKHLLLPPEGLCEPRQESVLRNTKKKASVSFQNDRHWTPAVYDYKHEPSQLPSPPREVKRPRRKSEKRHLNVKYLIEELSYIRYHRNDLGQPWPVVLAKFEAKFPMIQLCKDEERGRELQGLQGVNYRENKCLPHLIRGTSQLVFMQNGHVDPICVKTREQTEKRQLFTLVYLFPERAMQYSWVLPKHRQLAAELHEGRQKQKEQARIEAIKQGTYVEKLKPSEFCGCCFKEDRERDRCKRKSSPTPSKKPRLEFMAKL
ncbi:hypothetical protein F5Y19DRAFT_318182 [Xylariaceae sp. FL1651]|nr:hypothetical protein F5Y19DRAFT_318182 [Xylariaceae sp. FL1651]